MHIFQIKPDLQGVGLTKEFLRENYVGMAWPDIGNMEDLSREQVTDSLEQAEGLARLGEMIMFAHQMQDGDYLLMQDEEKVHLGDLGDYYYLQAAGAAEVNLNHRRGVTWLKSLEREELNLELQQFLLRPDPVAQFERSFSREQFEAWVFQSDEGPERVRVDSRTIQQALDILQEAMQSEDADRRERAAIAILHYAK